MYEPTLYKIQQSGASFEFLGFSKYLRHHIFSNPSQRKQIQGISEALKRKEKTFNSFNRRYGGHYRSATFGLGVYRQIYLNLIV